MASSRAVLGLAAASATLYAFVLLTIAFIERFPNLVPGDAPGLAVLVFFLIPFASCGAGVLALVLGVRRLLLRRGGKGYAALEILVGAPVAVLAPLLTPLV